MSEDTKDKKALKKDIADEVADEVWEEAMKHGKEMLGMDSPVRSFGYPSPMSLGPIPMYGQFIARIKYDKLNQEWHVVVPDEIIRQLKYGPSKGLLQISVSEVRVTGL